MSYDKKSAFVIFILPAKNVEIKWIITHNHLNSSSGICDYYVIQFQGAICDLSHDGGCISITL